VNVKATKQGVPLTKFTYIFKPQTTLKISQQEFENTLDIRMYMINNQDYHAFRFIPESLGFCILSWDPGRLSRNWRNIPGLSFKLLLFSFNKSLPLRKPVIGTHFHYTSLCAGEETNERRGSETCDGCLIPVTGSGCLWSGVSWLWTFSACVLFCDVLLKNMLTLKCRSLSAFLIKLK
jgi:hypothetical protein